MTQYEREVSSTDRAFIAHDAILPPTVVQLVLEGLGDLNLEELRAALDRTAQANPGSCLVLDETGSELRWRIGKPPALILLDAPEFEAREDKNFALLNSALHARSGPTCDVHLVRAKTRTYLIFRALHAVMDGQGVLAWARDFAKCLRGEEPLGHSGTLTVSQLLRDMAAPKRALPPVDALHPFGPANPRRATGPFHWRRLTIDRPFNAKISAKIGAALASRARARGGEGSFRLAIPADLRHYRPDERTTANFFGALHIEVPAGAEADDVAFRIVQALYTNESVKPVGPPTGDRIASLAAMQVAIFYDLARLDETGRYHFSATLSNLGMLKSAEFSAPGFQVTSAFFVPLETEVGCTVTLNGYDQHTEIAVGLSHRFAGDGRMEEFVDLMRAAFETTFTQNRELVAQKKFTLSDVSETAILTLRARAEEHARSDQLFADPVAVDWIRRVEWPSKLDHWWSSVESGRGLAFRADAIDHIVSQYHASVASLSVVELGCGLSTRRNRLSQLTFANWVDVDLPDMIELRRSLGAAGEHIAASVMDFAWMDRLHGAPSQQLFIAEGLLYYLQRAQAEVLFVELKRRFPGAAIVFDVVGVNEYATLLENTKSANAPIAWHLEGNYSDVLNTFDLTLIGELSPDRIMQDAFTRYWPHLTSGERIASYFVMNSPELMRGRSGTVLGRL